MSFSGVVLLAGGATAINALAAYHDGRDPFPIALAGGMLTTALAFVDDASSPIADGIAALFLVTTILTRGAWFFGWLAALVGPPSLPKPSMGHPTQEEST